MNRLAKLILLLLLSVPFVSGCTGFFGPSARRPLESRAIERLRAGVNSRDLVLWTHAVESCIDLRLSQAQDICIKAVSSDPPPLQFAGAMGLIELPSRDAEPALKKLLSSSDASVRLAAIGALHRLGQRRHSTELIGALESPSSKTRGDALMILGRVGDESAMPAIQRVFDKENVERVRMQAAEALVLLGDEKILPRLQLWQYSRNWQERIFAVELMCQVQDKELFVADLLGALGDRNQLVQLQAARSLGRLGQQDGFPQAMRYLHPTAGDQRAIAREMGVGMGERQLAERMVQIRSLAALALGEIGNWDAAAALGKAVDDKDAQVALAAAHASLRLVQKQR